MSETTPPNLFELPDKYMKNLFQYLSPVDCFNLALVSPQGKALVQKRSKLVLSTLFLRFDDEKSCVGAFFEKQKYTACVFYSWKKADGNRKFWTRSYRLKSHKFQSYIYTSRTHPNEVKAMQSACAPGIHWASGMMDTYQDLLSIFPSGSCRPYLHVGVNVSDKKAVQSFCSFTWSTIGCLRLIASKTAKSKRVKEVFRAANGHWTVRVAHQVGPACMHWKLLNSYNVILDDPEWITRDQLLSLNCVTADIGHNHLSADDLNAFIFQWLFVDSDQTRLELLEINLSPEAFRNKKVITEGLRLLNWDPKRREGEHFDVDRQLSRSRIRDPRHWMSCTHAQDIEKSDGRLATILFYGKKMHFIVWKDRFPYRTLKAERQRRMAEMARQNLIRALTEAVRVMNSRAEEEWNRKIEWVEREVEKRRAAAEERAAKRKYFEALQQFMDTSEPAPKRKMLKRLTVFKETDLQ
ncbi:unnamed protein product [Caenorhabditis sp. 36 PRJEB53466]|nr:unnamed protein product [Caenorhabditis sp. 36 PRJEB53466]